MKALRLFLLIIAMITGALFLYGIGYMLFYTQISNDATATKHALATITSDEVMYPFLGDMILLALSLATWMVIGNQIVSSTEKETDESYKKLDEFLSKNKEELEQKK